MSELLQKNKWFWIWNCNHCRVEQHRQKLNCKTLGVWELTLCRQFIEVVSGGIIKEDIKLHKSFFKIRNDISQPLIETAACSTASQNILCLLQISEVAILDSWDILASSEGEWETLRGTWQDIWQEGEAQDVTHTPNPIFNPAELPPLKLSLVGVWHNIKTCRRLQWQVYSLVTAVSIRGSRYNVQPHARHKSESDYYLLCMCGCFIRLQLQYKSSRWWEKETYQ